MAETIPETARTTTLRLDVPGWPGHRAGQHVDVRLTAEDGYQAQRSYSIASPPGADRLELTVVRIDDGEVSPYLTTVAEVGDQFEVRGPIGGWFVWDGDDTTPVLLVGGGSGVVPLMAMMRHHARTGSTAAMQLVYSARTPRRRHLPRRADHVGRQRSPSRHPHPHPRSVAGLDRASRSGRHRPARRGRLATAGSTPLLRLWTDAVRRSRQRRARRPRPRGRPGQDRTLRTDRRMR